MKLHLCLLSLLLPTLVCTGFARNDADKPKYVTYSQYGAVGDGVADDFEAIVKAHAAANKAGLPVKADAGATYYIGGGNRTARIETDTDWGDAKFIVDDRAVENRRAFIFEVVSTLPPTKITTVKTLAKGQRKLDLKLPHASFVEAIDKETLRYIREGVNQNNGAPQVDVFVVDRRGRVDMDAPIIWDFDNISSITAYPIDDKTLTVSGGIFTTIANQAESKYNYYARGIKIIRSNVVLDGLRHEITGEGDHGAPYGGFISVQRCNGVVVQNCMLSGHKIYGTIGAANRPVSMGSYDIEVNRSANTTIRNCRQINDIHDTRRWGIFASNYSKNITFDNVVFSRFDAHMGVANATIRNSVLGHQSINLIGCGTFLIENTKVCGGNFLYLRGDYGSTWEGDIVIRNCEYVPRNGGKLGKSDAVILSGRYTGMHDFGYPCHMPRKITIDGLTIDDGNRSDSYNGPKLFADFNSKNTNDSYKERYPYAVTEEVEIRGLTSKSGLPYVLSNNPYMFRNVKITDKK